jgi:hypothetical protein
MNLHSSTVSESSDKSAALYPDVSRLTYIDYICGHETMLPVIKEVEKIIGIPIEVIQAPGDASGPR